MKTGIDYYFFIFLPCKQSYRFELASNEFVGRAGFGPIGSDETEVGYLLCKKFWGKGYATEILSSLIEWANKYLKIDESDSATGSTLLGVDGCQDPRKYGL